MDDPLDGFPVVVDFPVAWRDMDAFGHVNNVQYLRWFEDGRLAYFGAVGVDALMEQTGIGPILSSTDCRFRIPLTYPDAVRIGAGITELTAERFTMRYVVVSRAHDKVAAEGHGELRAFDYRAGRKSEWPEELRRRIEALQGPIP